MLSLLMTLALTTTTGAKPATNVVCPVLGLKVTEKSKTVVVRGQEYYICCPGDCDTKLAKDPGKYLNEDGTTKNAPKNEKKPAPSHEGHGEHMH